MPSHQVNFVSSFVQCSLPSLLFIIGFLPSKVKANYFITKFGEKQLYIKKTSMWYEVFLIVFGYHFDVNLM